MWLLFDDSCTLIVLRKVPKVSPGAYIFQRPTLKGLFVEGLISGGAYIRRESCLTKSTIRFCRLHLFEDKDIYLTVTGNEETGYAEKLIVKPVKAVSAVRIYVFSSLWLERNLGATVLFFLCVVLYFRTIFKWKPPGACIRRKDLTEGFYVTGLAGLY